VASVISFLTRTKGSADGVHKYGAQDIVAYGYLLLGILIILVPVLWTVVSSFKPDEAIESFDTRLMPYDQIEQQIEGVGNKSMYTWLQPDGTKQDVFKAGPTRKITDVATPEDPATILQAPRKELSPAEEIRVATENYLDPLLQRNGQKYFNSFSWCGPLVFSARFGALLFLQPRPRPGYFCSGNTC